MRRAADVEEWLRQQGTFKRKRNERRKAGKTAVGYFYIPIFSKLTANR
jgi:hypothetical protein